MAVLICGGAGYIGSHVNKMLNRMGRETVVFDNLVYGQMSIVGPRPLPTYETAQLTQQQRKRMLVKPGLVCYWQVCGRNDIPFDEWMRMDYRYINEASILTDLKIICMAVPAVISGKGAE